MNALASNAELARENEELRRRLEEAEETLRAIRGGEVDAFLIHQGGGEEVLVLGGADRPYRRLLEKMQQGAVTVTADGVVGYANQRFADLLGVGLADIVGRPLSDFVPPGSRPLLEALLSPGCEGRSQGETFLRRPEGSLIPVLVAVSPLLEEAVFCLIVTDLTGQKRHEALVAAEMLSRSILDQAVDAIVVCDASGTVIRASQSAQSLAGGNPFFRSFSDVFPLERERGGPLPLSEVLGGATLRGVECRLPGAQGQEPIELLVSAGPVTGPDGELLGCVVTLTDITQRKRAEKELKEEARRKDEFLAMLAHELRNPLAPIRNAAGVLKLVGSPDPTAQSARETIERQVESMIRLVDDLLDVGRITQGKIKLQKERVSLASVVGRAVESARPFIEQRGHSLGVSLPPASLTAEVDVVRAAQVVLNLLTNASKFTPDGGQIWLEVQRAAGADGGPGEAVIRVRDTGIGIAADMLPRVFDLFTQADQTPGRREGGLGIGLTLVRRLTEMHGGSVEAFSAGPQQGSEFVVRLPLTDETVGEGEEARSAAGQGEGEGRAAPGRRILLVDDNRDAARSLAALLRLWGHEVRVSHDGLEALGEAGAWAPELILLDIGLPGLSGYEVAQQLRAMPEVAGTVLVALTGYGTESDRQRARAAGFDHHLVKPPDLDALEGLLGSLSRRHAGEAR